MKKSIVFLFIIIVFTGLHSQQVIENPERPKSEKAGRVLELREEIRIKDEPGVFYFKNPENIKVSPDGSIFILDQEQFLKFDKNGKFIKNFFKKGQGPGEFERIGNYLFCNNEIVVLQGRPNKIVQLDMQGELINEVKPEKAASKLITCFEDRYIMAHSSFPKLKKAGGEPEIIDIKWNLRFVTKSGKAENTCLSFPVKWYAQRVKNAVIANFIVDFTARPCMHKYLVIYHTQEYMLKLLDLESQQIIRAFTRKYKRVRLKPEKTGRVEIRPNVYTLVPPVDYHNDIQKLFVQKDRIWAMTSTMDKKKGILVDVFNLNGEYIDNFYLPLQHCIKLEGLSQHPITISGDSLFVIEYDEDDVPSVVKYKIKS
jgi:hypothetical protein